MEYQIYCPYHLKNEKLDVPDDRYFKGEMSCIPVAEGDSPRPLNVTVYSGYLVYADPVEHPDWEPPHPLW